MPDFLTLPLTTAVEEIDTYSEKNGDSYCFYYVLEGIAAFHTLDGIIHLSADDAILFRPHCAMPAPQKDFRARICLLAIHPDILHYTALPFLNAFPLFVQFCTHGSAAGTANTYLHFVHGSTPLRPQVTQIREDARHLNPSDPSAPALLSLHLTELFLLFMKNYQVKATIAEYPGSALLTQILQYIMKNYPTASLKEAAGQLHYHPNTISAAVRNGLGKSFTEVVQQIRMNHAVSMLLQQKQPVEEIARLCGYPSASNFYRIFHRIYGKSPKEYALSLREDADSYRA